MRYFGYAFAASLLPLYFLIFHVAWRRDRILAFLNPYADPPEARLPHHSIADCGQHRRADRPGLDGRQAETFLPSRAAHRFHFCGHGRGTWTGRRNLCGRIVRRFPVARHARCCAQKDMFGRFLAVGITSMVVLQAFINISVVLGMMPTKGIPLPLVSYGGSSLVRHAGMRWRPAEHHQAGGIRDQHTARHEPLASVIHSLVYSHPCEQFWQAEAPADTSSLLWPSPKQLKHDYHAEVLFIGTARGIENRLVPAAGFPLHLVEVGALKNVSLKTRLNTLFDLPRAFSSRPHAQ